MKDRGKLVEWFNSKTSKTLKGKISVLDDADREKLHAEGTLAGREIVRYECPWYDTATKTWKYREVKILIRAEKLKFLGFYD